VRLVFGPDFDLDRITARVNKHTLAALMVAIDRLRRDELLVHWEPAASGRLRGSVTVGDARLVLVRRPDAIELREVVVPDG
jgi:hypothetical protein